MKNKHFAIINIGASAFRMIISEYVDGKSKALELLIKPLSLGRDTFTKGYITLENVYKATEILKNFKNKMEEYKINKNYRAVCTSGVREAQNRYFFIDYVRINAGIDLIVLEPSDEIYIKYVGIRNDLKEFANYEKKGLIFANISSGNVAVSVHKDNIMIYSAALPYGSLRLNEIFKYIPIINRYKAYEQYVANMFYTIKTALPNKFKFQYVVASGSSITLLIDILQPEKNIFKKKELINLYNNIKARDINDIVKNYSIRQTDAEILLPTLTTYINLLTFTENDRIYFSRTTFPTMLSSFYSGSIKDRELNKRLRKSFYYLGERYLFDRNHAKIVSRFALKIFDHLKHIHSLVLKDRFLLEISAVLHEIGYFINARNHEEHSFHIIKAVNFPGFSKEAITIVALVALLHRENPSKSYEYILSSLSVEQRLVVNKLVSILRLADALDANHTKLVRDIEVILVNDRLRLIARALKHPFLEEHSFKRKSKLFLETFGIKPELEVKIDYE
jgi:exopolyphosphatase/guanosine-5'-triphosphate,3'-diphosphate pyrophosphatase